MENNVIIITGTNSPSGIGWATAIEIAKKQPKAIYVTDIRDDQLHVLAQTLREQYNVDGIARIVDASSSEQVKAVVDEAISTYGRLDVFFANAAIVSLARLHEETKTDFLKTMEVNTWSVFTAIQYASTAMEKTSETKKVSGGSIIATSSIAAYRSGAGPISYAASKAAILSLVKLAAWELKEKNIRVNAVCPGFIATDLTVPAIKALDKIDPDAATRQNPLGRFGVPTEIATTVAFLASLESSFINGQDIKIDGGFGASYRYVPLFGDA
ncbi:uncharacterized protein BX664DRAFT_336326 [Halteromyces radiatus]|uniref:uncharacterized protein n=1 Tax=Halteromyces radiatus TaxID=101107 RepID=UPI002220CBD5|nr:uncharacterized protein BX664DRAFT_336326 [Halteromyces radiatus]KAI8086617.1 hypothetical protein BX664DRAFT_336326 [Halteromyces radiatus]